MTPVKTNNSGKKTAASKTQGDQAEAWALDYLQKNGWQLVVANFRSAFGEIDLIVKQQQLLLFVEVKQRRSARFGSAQAMVTTQKQHKIILTSQYFLQQHSQYQQYHLRYDVIAIDTQGSTPQITWLPNAFYAY
jgi:putative endonuclease